MSSVDRTHWAAAMRRHPPLAGLALFVLFSLAGWWTTRGTPLPAAVLGFFAQAQIAAAAVVLLLALGGLPRRRLAGAFLLAVATSLAVEHVGVLHGVPFGSYRYSDLLGAKWLGTVPWTIPVSWAATSLAAWLWVVRLRPDPASRAGRVLWASLVLLAWDLALDPAMSVLHPYWTWEEPGAWFGVPLVNLFGWYLSGLLLVGLYEATLGGHGHAPSKRWLTAWLLLQFATPLGMLASAPGLWPAAAASVGLFLLVAWWLSAGAGRVFMARNSRSFFFATLFLGPTLRRTVTSVYRWCRHTDDLVDRAEDPPEVVRARLAAWEERARRAWRGEPTGDSLCDEVFGGFAARGVGIGYAMDLVEGVCMDLEPVRFETVAELRTYTYRVAGSIGCWLAERCGVRDRLVLDRACALGHALQITNILRDVGEDLRMGRLYIPLEVLRRHGLAESDLGDYLAGRRPVDAAWRGVFEEMASIAECEYELAYEGMGALPPDFRRAVAVAAEVYRGILDRIRQAGCDDFNRRAATSFPDKIRLAWTGLRRLRRSSQVCAVAASFP